MRAYVHSALCTFGDNQEKRWYVDIGDDSRDYASQEFCKLWDFAIFRTAKGAETFAAFYNSLTRG